MPFILRTFLKLYPTQGNSVKGGSPGMRTRARDRAVRDSVKSTAPVQEQMRERNLSHTLTGGHARALLSVAPA